MIIEFEGERLIVESGIYIVAGDTYIAKRNTGWKLLTCFEHNKKEGYVIPIEAEYPYGTHECFRVICFASSQSITVQHGKSCDTISTPKELRL